jgi:hypothetical protein
MKLALGKRKNGSLALLNADTGEELPCQNRLIIESDYAVGAKVIVTFVVDGEGLSLDPAPASHA